MALEYNERFSNFSHGWDHDDIGYFINPKRTLGVSQDSLLGELHNKAALISLFDLWFNPSQVVAPKNKEIAIMRIEQYIDICKQRGYNKNNSPESFYNYLSYIMLDYFLQAYKSPNTKVRESAKDVVDLSKTMGHRPQFEYETDKYNPSSLVRKLNTLDKLELIKSILIQYGNIDSLESSRTKTIYTSKFNIYDYFYNYLLMDFNIVALPKKIYDKKKEMFVDYKQNKFFEPSREIRLQEEITSIKKYVKLEDRPKYFR